MRYVPSAGKELSLEFVVGELRKISQVMNWIIDGHKDVLHAAPDKPQEGDLVFADGTDWDPGSGAGVYERVGGSWVKL